MIVKLQYLFDPFNFKIVEPELSKLLSTLSCHLLVMTQNPSLLNFPSEFPFLGLRMCLNPYPPTGCFTEVFIIATFTVCIMTSFRIYIFLLCSPVWRFTKTTRLETFAFPGFECKYTPSQYMSTSFYMFVFSGFECKYTPSQYMSTSFYMFAFSGFECKYTPSQYMSTSFYMFAFSGFFWVLFNLPHLPRPYYIRCRCVRYKKLMVSYATTYLARVSD
ncbi:hypothetical protein Hanom_Chr01g00024381 [Helianthus anomalus]